MIRLTQTRAPSSICMRDAYCRAVMELARKNPAIVSVEADVCSSMGMEPFRQEFPERSINCGIQGGKRRHHGLRHVLDGHDPHI